MKLNKLLRQCFGFSLVEVTVALALLGIAGMAVMKLSDNVNTQSKRSETILSKAQFLSSMSTYLSSAMSCSSDMMHNTFSQAPSPIVLNRWKVAGVEGNPNLPVSSGRVFKYFELTSLTATLDTVSTGLEVIKIDGIEGKKTILRVEAKITVRQGKHSKLAPNSANSNPRLYIHHFSVPVVASNLNKILACGAERTNQEICEASGGDWCCSQNKCLPKLNCVFKGSFVTLTQSSNAFGCAGASVAPRLCIAQKNPFTNAFTCPPSSTKSTTGFVNWSYTHPCSGKKCSPTTVNYTNVFNTCLECPTPNNLSNCGCTASVVGGTNAGGGTNDGGAASSCFVAGTEILLFDRSKKVIEDVQIGEDLLNIQGQKVKVNKIITQDYSGPIYSINGGAYFFTPNHPFLSTVGWKSLLPEASMLEAPGIHVTPLEVGDVLVKNGDFEIVLSIDSITTNEKVYNFTLDGNHEYIANEYAVHNKTQQTE